MGEKKSRNRAFPAAALALAAAAFTGNPAGRIAAAEPLGLRFDEGRGVRQEADHSVGRAKHVLIDAAGGVEGAGVQDLSQEIS